MSEQRNEAANIEQRYVAEQNDEEALVEGLDPAEAPRAEDLRRRRCIG